MSVRLDKWLQVARVFKTRSQATRACTAGRVRVDGRPAKAHHSVRPGERIDVAAGRVRRTLVIVALAERPLPKAEAATLFEEQTEARRVPDRDTTDEVVPGSLPSVGRERGTGRPSKRERRQLDRLRRR